jgi:uncharacterized protein (DUF2235 family)
MGLASDIRDAYVFLTRTYRDDDKLFMFGFSRGAYTVRAVASLLHMYGLIRPDNEPLVPYATRMLRVLRPGPGLQGRDDQDRVQALVRRRVGHRVVGRLGRESAEAALRHEQS